MERVPISWISIRHGEINCDGEVDGATAENILEERMLRLNSQIFQRQIHAIFVQGEFSLIFSQLSESHMFNGTQEFVLA